MMEIHVRLAGVEFGPYTEAQMREHLDEGLLSLTDEAREEGSDQWVSVREMLAKFPPTGSTTRVVAPTGPKPGAVAPLTQTALPLEIPQVTPPGASQRPPSVAGKPRKDTDKLALPVIAAAAAKKTIPLPPEAPSGRAPAVPAPSTITSPLLLPRTKPVQPPIRESMLLKAVSKKKTMPIAPAPPTTMATSPPPSTSMTSPLVQPRIAPIQGPSRNASPILPATLAKKASLEGPALPAVSSRITPSAPPTSPASPKTTPLQQHRAAQVSSASAPPTSPSSHRKKTVPVHPTPPVNPPPPEPENPDRPPTGNIPFIIQDNAKTVAVPSLVSALAAKGFGTAKPEVAKLSDKFDPEKPLTTNIPLIIKEETKTVAVPSLISALKGGPAITEKPAPSEVSKPPPTSPPLTTPLPKKTPSRPGTGAVPPPSVVGGLTKKLGRGALNEPPVRPPTTRLGTTPPTLDIDVTPVKPEAGPDKAEVPVSALRPDLPRPRKKRKRLLPPVLYVPFGLAVLAAAVYVWSPYHASAVLQNALNSGDAATLDGSVDFPAVRASLEDQMHVLLAKAGLASANGGASSNPASAAVLAVIDNSINLYVNPAGISALVNKSDSFARNSDQGQTIPPDTAAGILLGLNSQPVKSQGLVAWNDFAIELDSARFHLHLKGLAWKLDRIELQPDLPITASPPGAVSPLLAPVVDTYMQQGDTKLKKGEWNGALADFSQVLALIPQSSAAFLKRGLAFFSRLSPGDLDSSIDDFNHAIAADPKLAAAYTARGDAKAAKNDLDGAVADYTRAVQLDPQQAGAFFGRGNVETSKGAIDAAIADYSQAITLDPNQANYFSNRGFARQAKGNLDDAISDYTQALSLNPKIAFVYYNRGFARDAQGNTDAALLDYDQALKLDPKIAGAYFNRGYAKFTKHDIDGAIADYTQALAINPKVAVVYSKRAQALQAKGDLDGALADYNQALSLDPKISVAYYNRGLIKEEKNDLDGAISDSSQALDLDPKNAPAFYDRGLAKLTKGNLDGAVADLKQFTNLAPRDVQADHARLFLWLVAKAQNPKSDADQELADGLQNGWNSSSDDMYSRTAAFLLGRTTEPDYLASASSSDAKTDQIQQCQAWYFAGMKRLLVADKKTAIDYFHKCVATSQNDAAEFLLAQAELQVLEAPPKTK